MIGPLIDLFLQVSIEGLLLRCDLDTILPPKGQHSTEGL